MNDEEKNADPAVSCANCDWSGLLSQVRPLSQAPDLGDRLDPGDEVPAGECPSCFCFAYLDETGRAQEMRDALMSFTETIDVTGGIRFDEDRDVDVPCGDEEWSDLADAYIAACVALGRKPKREEDDNDEEDLGDGG